MERLEHKQGNLCITNVCVCVCDVCVCVCLLVGTDEPINIEARKLRREKGEGGEN